MGTVTNSREARSISRNKCNLLTEISVAWGERWSCKIIDMSEHGFGMITDVRLRKGDKVHILEPDAQASVVWIRNNRVGLKIYH